MPVVFVLVSVSKQFAEAATDAAAPFDCKCTSYTSRSPLGMAASTLGRLHGIFLSRCTWPQTSSNELNNPVRIFADIFVQSCHSREIRYFSSWHMSGPFAPDPLDERIVSLPRGDPKESACDPLIHEHLESRLSIVPRLFYSCPRHQQNLRQFVVHSASFGVTCISWPRRLQDLIVSSSSRFPSGFPVVAQQKVSWFLRLRSVGLNLGVVLR